MIPLLRRVATHLGIGPGAYLPALRPALVSTGLMVAAVLAVGLAIPADAPRLATLVIKIATGAVAYAGALWFFFRERILALVRLTTRLRGDALPPVPVS
jgi:hypothetical protein